MHPEVCGKVLKEILNRYGGAGDADMEEAATAVVERYGKEQQNEPFIAFRVKYGEMIVMIQNKK